MPDHRTGVFRGAVNTLQDAARASAPLAQRLLRGMARASFWSGIVTGILVTLVTPEIMALRNTVVYTFLSPTPRLMEKAKAACAAGDTHRCRDLYASVASRTDSLAAEAGFQAGILSDSLDEIKPAEQWLLKAARQGHLLAMYRLAALYEAVFRDEQRAWSWYVRAADLGFSMAQVTVAYKYQQKEAFLHAAHYYQVAVDQGDAKALTSLGMMYYFGRGVCKDYARAGTLFARAEQHGDPKAAEYVAIMSRNGEWRGGP